MLASSLFLILGAASALAQTPGALQQPAGPATAAAPYTLKSSTQRVLVDVVVKDKQGHPVHGLKQADFSVFEDKQPQQIKTFDEHAGLSDAAAAAAPAMPVLGKGEFTNLVRVKPNSAVTILLFDKLNTALRDQAFGREQLIKYLREARPDARIAIYGLTDHLILLQGFSSDPQLLLHALEDKSLLQVSPLRGDTIGGNNGVEDLSTAAATLEAAGGSSANVTAFQSQYQAFQGQIQGKYTLDALNALARSMASVPGRKNLIWFTGNFPISFFPGDVDATNEPFPGLQEEFEETIDLLTSAQIAIYPVDSQGLRTNAANNAGLSNSKFGTIRNSQSRNGLGIASALGDEDAATGKEHIGMEVIARETGGAAFYNSNALDKAVADALDSGTNYYTIAYSPAAAGRNTDFRSIAVKLNGLNYSLSYRRGYYADPASKKTRTALAGTAPQALSAVRTALLQGGPQPSEILLRIKATPLDSGGDASAVSGNLLNPDPSKSKGPYQVFQIDYATSIRAIQIRKTSDNLFHADLDFIAYVYDGHGTLVNQQSNTFRGTFTAQQLADTLRGGLPFTQKISVPDRGAHALRIAVHDNIGDKVGAIEISSAQLKALPVMTPPVSAKPAAAPPAVNP